MSWLFTFSELSWYQWQHHKFCHITTSFVNLKHREKEISFSSIKSCIDFSKTYDPNVRLRLDTGYQSPVSLNSKLSSYCWLQVKQKLNLNLTMVVCAVWHVSKNILYSHLATLHAPYMHCHVIHVVSIPLKFEYKAIMVLFIKE